MAFFWRFTDYFMDFQKVRNFQEICGIKEENNVSVESEESTEVESWPNADISDDNARCQNLYYACSKNRTNLEQQPKETYQNGKLSNKSSKSFRLSPEEYAKTYKITNWPLYYLFTFGSTLGHEIFYITFIPYVFWNVDPYIARKMVVVWVVTMYIGQALKDIIQWPRPQWPPVFKLETRVEAEYGIPSTHAVAGTALPFSLLLAMYNRYEFSLELGILLACLWCGLVACSRLYVGMHSILDVMAGIAIAAVYLWLGWPFMDMVEDYTLKSPYAPGIIILSHFLLGLFYPSTSRYSTSRGDTAIILAAGAGIHVASWMCHQYDYHFGPSGEPPYQIAMPTGQSFAISMSRALIGFVVLFLVRMSAKYASLSLVCSAVGVAKNDPASRRRKDVEITYKFITYVMVGFSAQWVVPQLLAWLRVVH